MNAGIVTMAFVSCTPLATVGLGVDALAPEVGDVELSVGAVTTPDLTGVGAQADLPLSARTAATASFGITPEKNPSTLSRLLVRYRFTDAASPVALSLLGGVAMPTWVVNIDDDDDGVFTPHVRPALGPVFGVMGSVPREGWRVGLASTVGTAFPLASHDDPALQMQLLANGRVQLIPRLYVAAEAGAMWIPARNGDIALVGLIRLGGDVRLKTAAGETPGG